MLEEHMLAASSFTCPGEAPCSDETRWGPIFCCVAEVGVIGKGRLFDSTGNLAPDTFKKFGCDSFLMFGRYTDRSTVGTPLDTCDDTDNDGVVSQLLAPPNWKLERFYVLLDPTKLKDVRLWREASALNTERLRRLPSEPLFFIVSDSQLSADECNDVFSREHMIALCRRLCDHVSVPCTRGIAWNRARHLLANAIAGRRRQDCTDQLQLPLRVVAVNLALGNVATVHHGEEPDEPVDTTVLPIEEPLQRYGQLLSEQTAEQAAASFPHLDSWERKCFCSAVTAPVAKSNISCARGFELKDVRCWEEQLIALPQWSSAENAQGGDAASLRHPDVFAVCMSIFDFVTMCFPSIAPVDKRRQGLQKYSVHHQLVMMKKKNVPRVVELPGIASSLLNRSRTYHKAATGAFAALPNTEVIGTTASQSVMDPLDQHASLGKKQLRILWDLSTVPLQDGASTLKALLRMLSLQDMFDTWSWAPSLHFYMPSQKDTDGPPPSIATAWQLVSDVDVTLHAARNSTTSPATVHLVGAMLRDADMFVSAASVKRSVAVVMLSADESLMWDAAARCAHTPLPGAKSQRQWGDGLDAVALCTPSKEVSEGLAAAHSRSAACICKMLVARVDNSTDTFVFHPVVSVAASRLESASTASARKGAAAQGAKRRTASAALLCRDGREPVTPPELTIAAMLSAGGARRGIWGKSYAWAMLPILNALWQVQLEQNSVDVLLRDVFAHVRSQMFSPCVPPTIDVLNNAFNALVNKEWVTPGYGKWPGMEGKACWVCFPSQLIDASTSTALVPAAVLSRSKLTHSDRPGTALAFATALTRDADEMSMMSMLPSNLLGVVTSNTQPAPLHDGSGGTTPPLLAAASLHLDCSVTGHRVGRIFVTHWANAHHEVTLDTFPLRICALKSSRQWMPLEIHSARERDALDELRVLIALMTLQRQHGQLEIDVDALVKRCITIERMAQMMQGGVDGGAGYPGAVELERGTGSYAGLLAKRQHGSGAFSQWSEETFRAHIDNAVMRDRSVARLSNSRLCFVSDVLPATSHISREDLEVAALDADYSPTFEAPPELAHVFVRASLVRLLFARAVRDEQRIAFPQLAVRLREVRRRWHDFCFHSGLAPSATLWEMTRLEMERSKMLQFFVSPTSHLTMVLFWSDAVKIGMTVADYDDASRASGRATSVTASAASTPRGLDAVLAPLPPTVSLLRPLVGASSAVVSSGDAIQADPSELYYAFAAEDPRLVGEGARKFELNKSSFRHDVQLFPCELTYATQQDSLPEHYLLVLHALQKLQRSVVVDAVVCDYLVMRMLSSHSSSTPTGLSQRTGAASHIPTSPPVWSRVRETQSLLAHNKLIYISGADVAFCSDYMFHDRAAWVLPKVPRANALTEEPAELHHHAAVLDVGVRALLEALMHFQRLWKRVKVPWDSLARVLNVSQQLPITDSPEAALERTSRAHLIHVETAVVSLQQGWSRPGTMVCFATDVAPPLPPPAVPPSYDMTVGPTHGTSEYPSSSLSKGLNPNSKPFVLQSSCHLRALVEEAEKGAETTPPQLPSSEQMLAQLTTPVAPLEHVLEHRRLAKEIQSPNDAVVPLSSLSRRRRVVQRNAADAPQASPSQKSVLSQLFLTLERLEGRQPSEGDEETSVCSSTRPSTPAVGRDSHDPVATPKSPTSAAVGGGRFISALAWLFESALEEVSSQSQKKATPHVVPHTKNTSAAEDERRKKLYYSTLAAFFDTAAHGQEGERATESSDDDFAVSAPTIRLTAEEGGVADLASARAEAALEIVVPSRNRPQLSSQQKRAIRQVHAKLTQAAMTEALSTSEPWESVGFFFAKAEAIAGIV